jgi:hypothetical protein
MTSEFDNLYKQIVEIHIKNQISNSDFKNELNMFVDDGILDMQSAINYMRRWLVDFRDGKIDLLINQ